MVALRIGQDGILVLFRPCPIPSSSAPRHHALAVRILEVWLKTPFAGGRHAGRIAKIEMPKAFPK